MLPPGTVIEVAPPALPDITTVAPGPTNVLIMPVPGAPGKTGAPGDNANIYNEVPTGTQDGTNEVFSLVHNFVSRSTIVFRNGLREQIGYSYHETPPNQITFTTAPLVDDVLTVDYLVE
jgi:hypothetical protein